MADFKALADATEAFNKATEARKEEALKALAAGGTFREVAPVAGVAIGTLLRWRNDSGWDVFKKQDEADGK